jgi:hypothetical protein
LARAPNSGAPPLAALFPPRLAVTITLALGLIVTAGVPLLLVGALNPVSMAFAILFVGLGADFPVQFNLRYRAQRHASSELHRSLIDAADRVSIPLDLAAVAASTGFLSPRSKCRRHERAAGLTALTMEQHRKLSGAKNPRNALEFCGIGHVQGVAAYEGI